MKRRHTLCLTGNTKTTFETSKKRRTIVLPAVLVEPFILLGKFSIFWYKRFFRWFEAESNKS